MNRIFTRAVVLWVCTLAAAGAAAAAETSDAWSTTAQVSTYVHDDHLEVVDAVPGLHLDANVGWRSPERGVRLDLTLRANTYATVLFVDASSSLRASWTPAGWSEDEHLGLTLYPLNADDVHLGFSHPVSWARELTTASSQLSGSSLGTYNFAALSELERRRFGFFAGVKGFQAYDLLEPAQRLYVAPVAGARFEVGSWLRLEANGLWMRGEPNPMLAQRGIKVLTDRSGFSARGTLHWGAKVAPIEDFGLYASDPRFFERLFAPASPEDGFSFSVELTQAWVQLGKAESYRAAAPANPAVTVPSRAAAVEALLQRGPLTVHALATFRDLNFILLSVPGSPMYFALPNDSVIKPEWQARLAAAWTFSSTALTPGIVLSAEAPASMTDQPLLGRTLIFNGPSQAGALDAGEAPSPLLRAQVQLRWVPVERFAFYAEGGVLHDATRTQFLPYFQGPTTRASRQPPMDSFSVGLLAQIRL